MKQFILIVCIAFIGKISAQSLNDNLLLHYPLNGNADDLSSNGYNGTENGGLSYQADRFGNPNSAAYFDGIDDFIDLPNLVALKPDLPLSLSFWIYYESLLPEKTALFNTSFEEDVNSGVYFTSQLSTGGYAVGFGDGSNGYASSSRRTYVSNSSITLSTWHHVAIIIEGNLDMKIYVDCEETGGTYSGSGGNIQYSLSPGTLGRHDQNVGIPAYYFQGALDDFRYWNRALTLNDLDTLCNNLLELPSTNAEESVFAVYPNPAAQVISIRTNLDEISLIRIIDINGRLVHQMDYQNEFNLPEIEAGIYIIQAIDSQEKILVTSRLLVE